VCRAAGALNNFSDSQTLFPGQELYGGLKKVLAAQIWNDYNASVGANRQSMRFKLLSTSLLALAFAGSDFAAIVTEKQSRQLPFVEVVDCQGIHSFVFRGPKGTSRKPIRVPPEEYWTVREAGLYKFVLRYQDGNTCSRLVTPEVFARYRVGDDFRDSEPFTERVTEDSKTVQPVVHHRKHTAQTRKHARVSRQVAKHRRAHRSRLVAQR